MFYTEPLLAHLEALGTPVINPVAAWRYSKLAVGFGCMVASLGILSRWR